MSTAEEYHRLEITLSTEARALLDRLQQVGDFQSQSRTLEELLFAMDDLTSYIINIMDLVPKGEAITEDMIRNTIMMIALRLQKFGLWDVVGQQLSQQNKERRYY
jgi:hypothetical protein